MAVYCPRIRSTHDQNKYCPSVSHEDTRVVEFGHESANSQFSGKPNITMFRDYGGEDFARYLKDDDEVQPVERKAKSSNEPGKQHGRNRYRRQRSRNDEVEDVTSPIGPFQMDHMMTSPSDERPRKKSADGLMDRLAQLIPRSNRPPRCTSRQNSKIQDYSFTDLKVGSSLVTERRNSGFHNNSDDTNSEIRSSVLLETRSDLGYPHHKSSWWNIDTLSDRNGVCVDHTNIAKSKTRRTKGPRRRAKSVPDILDPGPVNTDRVLHRDDLPFRDGSVVGPVSCWDEDVRSQTDKANGQKNSPQRSFWKRVTYTFKSSGRKNPQPTEPRVDGKQFGAPGSEGQLQMNQIQRQPGNTRRLPMIPLPSPPVNDSNFYDEIRL